MKALILTAKFGMGHYSAAYSLSADLKAVDCDIETTVKDILACAMPSFHRKIYHSFELLVNKGSKLYHTFYKFSSRAEKQVNIARYPMGDFLVQSAKKLIETEAPDIIFSTIPVASDIITAYKEKTGSKIPLVTCITDISVHPEWFNTGSDFYLVGSDMVKHGLTARGFSEETIFVYGIPVQEVFKEPDFQPHSPEKHLLMMGGGLGMVSKDMKFYEKINRLPNVKTKIITGNNLELLKKLKGTFPNIEVIGFTKKVHKYMQWADLILSKPGGITLFEAMHVGVPMAVVCPTLPQEINNARFIEQNNIGKIFWKRPKDEAQALYNFLQNDYALLMMKRNMRRILKSLDSSALQKILSGCRKRKGQTA